jgi:eukaryotic-like serine/threonine-protein kinase
MMAQNAETLEIDVAYEDDAQVISLVDARHRLVGRVLGGKYRVAQRIAEGGMGRVFAAMHLELQRPVAVKVMRPELARHESLIERFVNEARAAAMLRSENVVHVLDAGTTDDGLPYFVMELLDGETVAELVSRYGAFPLETAVEYALQMCAGLVEAHALGIIHRDLKPQNLLVIRQPDGTPTVKILDFGIAKLLFARDRTNPTQATDTIGSPSYMSPEQMRAPHDVDHRTDIWSLGTVLYEMVTGHAAFDGKTIPGVCANVLAGAPLPIGMSRQGVPQELEAVILRCLRKDRGARFASISAVTQALTALGLRAVSTRPFSHRPKQLTSGGIETERTVGDSSKPFGASPSRTALGGLAFASAAVVAGFAFVSPDVGAWVSGPLSASTASETAERVYVPPPLILFQPSVNPGAGAKVPTDEDALIPVMPVETQVPAVTTDRESAKPTVTSDRERSKPIVRSDVLSPEQKRRRYREWLAAKGLRPVGELEASEAQGETGETTEEGWAEHPRVLERGRESIDQHQNEDAHDPVY